MDAERHIQLTEMIANEPIDHALQTIVHELRQHLTEIEGTFNHINADRYSELDQKFIEMGKRGLYNTFDTINVLLMDQFLPRLRQMQNLDE
ncbi:MAG: hypothetical protein AAGF95_24665 [Chloroflexota bacterium]